MYGCRWSPQCSSMSWTLLGRVMTWCPTFGIPALMTSWALHRGETRTAPTAKPSFRCLLTPFIQTQREYVGLVNKRLVFNPYTEQTMSFCCLGILWLFIAQLKSQPNHTCFYDRWVNNMDCLCSSLYRSSSLTRIGNECVQRTAATTVCRRWVTASRRWCGGTGNHCGGYWAVREEPGHSGLHAFKCFDS